MKKLIGIFILYLGGGLFFKEGWGCETVLGSVFYFMGCILIML
jgi:hypothetical protein